jgi:2-haloacid dehalogenase
MNLTDFKVLSFDCYGTLIDWETGIWNELEPLLRQEGAPRVTRDEALSDFSAFEPIVQEQHPNLLYRDLLARVHNALAAEWRLPTSKLNDECFGGSIGAWPAFADSQDALVYLKRHFKLVILSNVDRQSFAATNQRLGVTFDAICTAEDIGSYKPDPRNFNYLIEQVAAMGYAKSEILHTAQSLYHDHNPAERLGIARCWINRRGGQGGATKPIEDMPKLDFEFASLGAMAEAHRREVGAGL